MTIGVAGFGKMGAAIAGRLKDLGEDVLVWNRDLTRPQKAGFAVAETPRKLASACGTTLSSLFNDEGVLAVYTELDDLLASGSGRIFIEMSTVRPETQRFLASEAARQGATFFECPVGGSTGPARKGELLGLLGCDQADVTRARPVLEKLCRRIEHVGPIGAGAVTKLAINLPLLAFWASFGEAMALMRPLDKDPAWLVDLFGDTAGTAAVMKVKANAMVSALAGRDEVEPTFDIDAMRKDLGLMIAQAAKTGVPLPVSEAVERSFNEAAAIGWGGRDCVWASAFRATKT